LRGRPYLPNILTVSLVPSIGGTGPSGAGIMGTNLSWYPRNKSTLSNRRRLDRLRDFQGESTMTAKRNDEGRWEKATRAQWRSRYTSIIWACFLTRHLGAARGRGQGPGSGAADGAAARFRVHGLRSFPFGRACGGLRGFSSAKGIGLEAGGHV